jgi:hypothetical protein
MRERVERQFYNAGLGATGAGKLGTTSACPSITLGALRLGLQRCLEVLDHGLKLLVRQLLDRIAVLDFVLAPD